MDEVPDKLSDKAHHILAATITLARSLRANNPTTTQRSSSLDRLAASLATATKSSAPQSSPQTSHRVPLEDVTNSNTSAASWESGSSTAVATPSGDTLFLRVRRSKSDSSIGEGDMRSSKPTILPRISRTGSSPYTYAYESLNGNGGISRTIYAWRRFLIGGTLLIILAWASMGWTGLTGVAIDERPINSDFEFSKPKSPPSSLPPFRPPSRPPANTKPPPILSFTADQNPSSTEQCQKAYTSPDGTTKPIVQWALMIDAGSTGSRIHIYKFNNCAASPSFEYEVFRQTRPGLSSYAAHPEQAAESLDVLMQEAEQVVPRSLWSCTPVAVKATAGLRLLGVQESEAILTAVRVRLETTYKFRVVERNGVEIMDGKDEGVHAWVTANYLLDALPTGRTAGVPPTTPYAVLDLGGASTQIVFKPSFDLDGDGIDDDGKGLEEGEHKYVLRFQGGNHVLYQHSYLGYGLMRARAHVHRLVEFMSHFTSNTPPATKHDGDEEDEWEVVYNPCIARGMKRRVEVDIGREGVSVLKNVTMMGGEVGSWEACNRVLELVLAKDAVCHLKPCSFNGVYQPSLMDSFPTGSILLLSYFYDRLAPLLTPSLPPPTTPSSPKIDPTESLVFPISMIKNLAQMVCGGERSWSTSSFPVPFEGGADQGAPKGWADSREVLEELHGRPEWCLDLSFMYALLRLGYEFGEDRGVRIGKQVRGTELGWCLGATLGLLGNVDFECRA